MRSKALMVAVTVAMLLVFTLLLPTLTSAKAAPGELAITAPVERTAHVAVVPQQRLLAPQSSEHLVPAAHVNAALLYTGRYAPVHGRVATNEMLLPMSANASRNLSPFRQRAPGLGNATILRE